MRKTSVALTYAMYGRKYAAPLRPTKVLHVDPTKITKIPVEKPSVPIPIVSGVDGGNWDLETRRVADDVVYESFEKHFLDEYPWKDTEYHSFMLDRIKDTSSEWRHYETLEDAEKRYKALDRLYQNINEQGYKSQQELTDDQFVIFSNKDKYGVPLPPEFKEISVYVSRDGEFQWAAGMHRLCIAKLVGIDTIPVRVRLRHKKWQEYRDSVYLNRDETRMHPDIGYLVDY